MFRSDETSRITLNSRNIDEVTVRVYAVDLETYFRKMHLARGVEGLDIALIDPDQTLTFRVPDYEKFKPIESQIEINWDDQPKAAALAVTVSSPTLEATTLVLKSDLDLIAKSSRDEVFVFTENMQTKQPWGNVRLLISDGEKVFAEARTNDEGVFQASYEQLKTVQDLRVFAVADDLHYASNTSDLRGLGISEGLADKGYIYTDRPAYRAGQMVHLRGVIRRVAGDRYQVDEKKPLEVHVFDPRGRQLWTGGVQLSRFGSFQTHLVLPDETPPGPYRVDVREAEPDGAKRSYQGTFLVHEYRLEPIRLRVDTERQVYYRGEKISGTIRAEFYYGAPLAESEIRYRLADGEWTTARTDAKGEVKFEFETREYRETQSLPLVVLLPERDLATQAVFILATRGFSIALETSRDVFLAKETFEAKLTTTDAEGKPVSRTLELQLLQQTNVRGKTGERVISTSTLTTSAEDGVGRLVLAADQGGSYLLRATGTDRFDNPITAEHSLNISDEDDSVRLRVLASQHTFKVGDDASIRVHWREDSALALVTYQGARVLGYQLIELESGDNELPIAMSPELAPNFDLHIAVMTDARDRKGPDGNPARRFHEASTPLTVVREMQVQVRVVGDRTTYTPGTDIDVQISTTDPQGHPLAAELSLAMVEQALLDQFFPDSVAPINEFFRGTQRESAVRTSSSVTFDYRPETRPIATALLAERERLEVANAEAERLAELGDIVADNVMSFGVPVRETMDALAEDEPLSRFAREAGTDRGRVGNRRGQMMGGMGGMGGGQMGGVGGGQGPTPAAGDFAAAFSPDARSETPFDVDGDGIQSWEELSSGRAGAAKDSAGSFASNGMVLPQDEKSLVAFFNKNFATALPATTGAQDSIPQSIAGSQEAAVIQNDGSWGYLNLSNMNAERVQELANGLAGTGARLLSGLHSPETGYWNPVVVTDESGQATLTITLPERSTAWQLTARGITTETMAGEATAKLSAQKPLFGELKLPLALVDGDTLRLEATVHSDIPETHDVIVTLTTKVGDWERTQTQTIPIEGKGLTRIAFEQTIWRVPPPAEPGGKATATVSLPMEAIFELAIVAGDQHDTLRRIVPILPYGVDVVSTASGAADTDATAWIALPAEMPVEAPEMQIVIAPDLPHSLLDVVLAPVPNWCHGGALATGSELDTTSSDLLAALALARLVNATPKRGGPETLTLEELIRSSISTLVASQRDDGGWTWTGGANNDASADPFVSARILWALSDARDAGYSVPDDSFAQAVNFTRNALSQSPNDTYEIRAVLVHALATAGQGDFAQANRLFRERQSLSAAGLAYASLTFAEMDRLEIARQLLDVVSQRNLIRDANQDGPDSRLSWQQGPTEVRALYALALQRVNPAASGVAAQIDWLLAHRSGHRWSPDKATGPATMAVANWLRANQTPASSYALTILVNDRPAAELQIDGDSSTQTVAVPREFLSFVGNESQQTIRFLLKGRGHYSYQILFGGFVSADKVRGTTKQFGIRREYEPAPIELDGRMIPRGFGIVEGSYTTFRNPLTQLPIGQRGHVILSAWRNDTPSRTPDQELPYLVITEPILSGTSVVENSIHGAFERYELVPGAIIFYVGNRRHLGTIQYELNGYLGGRYRSAPTIVRDAYNAAQIAVSDTKELEVLPLGSTSSDPYRMTPQEMFELGKRFFDKRDFAATATQLGKLLTEWNLQPEPYQESVRKLLDAHLEIGPPQKVVEYFEIVKEKWPELEIDFDKILRIGAAYHAMGEYERSYMVFRATVESRFMTEVRVAGFLQNEGEFLDSVRVMQQILAVYPPESYVAEAQYGLSQQLYLKGAEAATDPKLRAAKTTRVDLLRQTIDMLQRFLTEYPEDPAADQASFSLASALLELEQYQAVIAQCQRSMKRFPKSDLFDSFLYTIGFCHFALGEHEAALTTCRRVADMTRTNEQTGIVAESDEKWRAIYILGQIYHSLGKAAEAIVEYNRVADRFPDAREAVGYFQRRDLKLAEVTTRKPDDALQLPLQFRNVTQADLRVYRIDLMKFSLLKRNLENIRGINLAGIRPFYAATIELGDGKDYRDREVQLQLPLSEEGAYLVVCRGDDLHTSGLVLVSPLKVDVQEDQTSGRVRVTVKNTVDDRFLADVHVKVIGSNDSAFQSGQTDLRGVFVADGNTGTITVIAQHGDGRYAFYRGTESLGEPPTSEAGYKPQAAAGEGAGIQRKTGITEGPGCSQSDDPIRGQTGA